MPKHHEDEPDLRLVEGVVSDKILRAAHAASSAYAKLGIRHALVGGLAVGAYGYARATKDVDFVVGDEAFIQQPGGGLVTLLKVGVPWDVDGVRVDSVPADRVTGEQLDESASSEGIPIVDVEVLIYMKLLVHRRQDKLDIVKLLQAGADEDSVREYLEENARHLIPLFDSLAEKADEEE